MSDNESSVTIYVEDGLVVYGVDDGDGTVATFALAPEIADEIADRLREAAREARAEHPERVQ